MNKHTKLLFLGATLATAMMLGGCNKPPETAVTLPVTPTTVGNVSDIDVTEHVKTALQSSELLKGFNITVETTKGDVRLIGELDNQMQIDHAISVARAAEGAHTFHNELTLKK